MDQKIRLSVIIPAYNVAEWLPRCLKSVTDQTYRNLEIIIIDDGSSDDTPRICDEWAEKDSRITAVHQENSGLIEVRERGIRMASGDYVGFVDGDDDIEADMYERLLKNAVDHSAKISQCGILYCFYDGRKKPMHGTGQIYVFGRDDGYIELMKGTRMEPSLCNKIYQRSILQDSCPDKSIVNNEDLLRNSVLFSRTDKSVFEDFCGYHYWRREDSMSNNRRTIRVQKNILKARKLILDSAWKEVRNAALESYVTALVSTYNQLIRRKDAEAGVLRNECIAQLKMFRSETKALQKGTGKRVQAILYARPVYNAAHRLHVKRKYARIRRNVRHIRKEK